MRNATYNTTEIPSVSRSVEEFDVLQIIWLVGISVSIVGMVSKILFFLLIPKCRKFDENVLFQLTIARTLNTICEYYIMHVEYTSVIIKDIVYTMYMQTDLVLVLWMFMFSKNLYNKVVFVFVVEKPRLVIMSGLIWTISLPVGLICPFLIKLKDKRYFKMYYQIYAHIKLFVIVINALIFIEIFNVAIRRGNSSTRNVKDFIKTAIVAFILICITSLQVLVTDMLSIYYYTYSTLIIVFCVINSYQVIAISVIFIILAKSKTNESVFRSMSIKLREFVAQTTNI